jgi:hypothetical protein
VTVHTSHDRGSALLPEDGVFASLSESLLLDARRGSAMEGVRCVSNTNTLWSVRNEATLRDVMRRVREKEPFGWLRFADGDMNQLERTRGFQDDDVARRMTRAMEAWATLPNLVVSVGEWWLCKASTRTSGRTASRRFPL